MYSDQKTINLAIPNKQESNRLCNDETINATSENSVVHRIPTVLEKAPIALNLR